MLFMDVLCLTPHLLDHDYDPSPGRDLIFFYSLISENSQFDDLFESTILLEHDLKLILAVWKSQFHL